MRTKQDSTQNEVVEGIERTGRHVIKCQDVAKNVGLPGFPDLIAVGEDFSIILRPDLAESHRRELRAFIESLDGVVSCEVGAMYPIEVKTEAGKLNPDQVSWWKRFNLEPRIFRSGIDVLRFFGREIL